ncbi:fibronectin type III domain-containing protein [Jiangella endophytica]|uniref:fibronectin type III domain-containing protein n=1 Tax=Jiangella endophytica TaxID=1623398 RepID=UPI0013002817|nr:fibronectin type III domain-containing protein [Jiangella endophytica]
MKALWIAVVVPLVGAGALAGASLADGGAAPTSRGAAHVVQLDDARLKFEINSTDGDGGVQLFGDSEEPWARLSVYDPHGKRIFTSTTKGTLGRQGGTELFLESGEPPFTDLPLKELLARFPEGTYEFRGRGIDGERLAGEAELTHDIPDGPTLVAPTEGDGPQNPDATTVSWKPVGPANGSPIIAYEVIVVDENTGLDALPEATMDVMMPPSATSVDVPPGFLKAGTDYTWEVLAIEQSGNQTISSDVFTTAG